MAAIVGRASARGSPFVGDDARGMTGRQRSGSNDLAVRDRRSSSRSIGSSCKRACSSSRTHIPSHIRRSGQHSPAVALGRLLAPAVAWDADHWARPKIWPGQAGCAVEVGPNRPDVTLFRCVCVLRECMNALDQRHNLPQRSNSRLIRQTKDVWRNSLESKEINRRQTVWMSTVHRMRIAARLASRP